MVECMRRQAGLQRGRYGRVYGAPGRGVRPGYSGVGMVECMGQRGQAGLQRGRYGRVYTAGRQAGLQRGRYGRVYGASGRVTAGSVWW